MMVEYPKLPLITIITIVYNGEQYLQECISSIKKQAYTNIEYIIIDGKSTDNTLKIIEQNRDVVNILVSEKDRGISDAFNKGIALAKGELIGILNSDDFYTDNCVTDVVDFFIENQMKSGILWQY